MAPPFASPSLQAAFLALAALPFLLLVLGLREAGERAGRAWHGIGPLPAGWALRPLLAVTLWLSVIGTLAERGVLADFDARPPPLALLLVAVLVGCAAFVRSDAGRLLGTLPVGTLVIAQAFRLPLEIAMHHAAVEGVMPVQMSYEGWNLDVLTGATALVVGPLALAGRAPRWLLLAWNALGTALLVNILVIAVASTPMFAAFGPDRLNTWVAFFPFVVLPGLLVPTAIVGHALLWRRLLAEG